MTERLVLKAETRKSGNKGVARRLRAAGRLPAVMYGKGEAATAISIDPKETAVVLRTEYGFNNVFSLELDGQQCLVMLKDYQFDSVTRVLTHADFYQVDEDQMVTLKVPVKAVGKSAGEKAGGMLKVAAREVPLRCKVRDIPSAVTHDVTEMEVLDSAYIDELTPPEGCEFVFKNRFPVIVVAKKRGAKRGGEDDEEVAAAAPVAE